VHYDLLKIEIFWIKSQTGILRDEHPVTLMEMQEKPKQEGNGSLAPNK